MLLQNPSQFLASNFVAMVTGLEQSLSHTSSKWQRDILPRGTPLTNYTYNHVDNNCRRHYTSNSACNSLVPFMHSFIQQLVQNSGRNGPIRIEAISTWKPSSLWLLPWFCYGLLPEIRLKPFSFILAVSTQVSSTFLFIVPNHSLACTLLLHIIAITRHFSQTDLYRLGEHISACDPSHMHWHYTKAICLSTQLLARNCMEQVNYNLFYDKQLNMCTTTRKGWLMLTHAPGRTRSMTEARVKHD